MALPAGITKRYAFCIAILVVTAALVILTVRGGYHRNLHTAIKEYVGTRESVQKTLPGGSVGISATDGGTGGSAGGSSGGGGSGADSDPTTQKSDLARLRPSDIKQYRFDNGRIVVGSSIYNLSPDRLGAMSPKELEVLYENAILETTADCSTSRRLGRREDGGWDLCLVGPFVPAQPCFSFSFGINNIWEFDDEVASTFKCQVLTFDPSMSQNSYMRSDKVAFFKEGLHGSKGTLNSWSVNTYLGFLNRFKAENYIIDILKMDIEASEWASLETAVKDGSLKNVKQLMIETHISQAGSVKDFQGYFFIIKALYDQGFRQWHHNWNTYGNYRSKLNSGEMRSCCHELYYVNINFLTGGRTARNPSGTQIASPLTQVAAPLASTASDVPNAGKLPKISKMEGNSQVDTVLALNLGSVPAGDLENMYFGIVEKQHILCPNSVRIGDSGDGGWDVCFTSPYSILDSKPCIAFSFGINGVWGYDDLLADKYHCKVYMFDPSMTTVNDHQRKTTSWFYRTGLSSENKVESNGWKMRTLCTLFDELGYSGKPVDILKIDIEHWEWVSFEKALQEGCLKNVKQLLFESHTSELVGKKSDYGRFIRIWSGLFSLGFRTWKWHKNPASVFYKSAHAQRACCYEHYMLNTKFTEL